MNLALRTHLRTVSLTLVIIRRQNVDVNIKILTSRFSSKYVSAIIINIIIIS
jgi:hypothetical protein